MGAYDDLEMAFPTELPGANAELDEAPHINAAAAANRVLRLNIMLLVDEV
jgi:hypothetical protein